jgi:hypothetical protein
MIPGHATVLAASGNDRLRFIHRWRQPAWDGSAEHRKGFLGLLDSGCSFQRFPSRRPEAANCPRISWYSLPQKSIVFANLDDGLAARNTSQHSTALNSAFAPTRKYPDTAY